MGEKEKQGIPYQLLAMPGTVMSSFVRHQSTSASRTILGGLQYDGTNGLPSRQVVGTGVDQTHPSVSDFWRKHTGAVG